MTRTMSRLPLGSLFALPLPLPLLLLLLGSLSGCIPAGPRVTDTLALQATSEPAPRFDDSERHSSLLQLFIGYRSVIGHAAVRLVAPGDRKIFWDPGSHYGSGDKAVDRRRDVIVGDAVPSPMAYMNYRFDELPFGETSFVVMEYFIDDQIAEQMYDALLAGREASQTSASPLKTDRATFFCAVSVSEFLIQYAPDDLAPKAVHAYPHDLVQDLLQHHPPRRLIVFRPDRTANIYTPAEDSSK